MEEKWVSLIFVGVWACVALFYGWRSRFFSFREIPLRWGEGRSPVYFAFLAEAVIVYLVVQLLIGVWVHVAPSYNVWLSMLASLLGFGAVLGAFRLFHHRLISVIWGQEVRFWAGIYAWLFAFPVSAFVGRLVGWVVEKITGVEETSQLAIEQFNQLTSEPVLYYCMAVYIALIVPVVEEFFFRGLLQTWLRCHMNRGRAILLASCIFALSHFALSQGWSNFEIVAQLFFLSLFLGFLYEREQSLWAPIALHATNNLVVTLTLILT
ncbi:MAG: CPBP family intramembrane metalloprotease [Verrucomicrobia bacterium]|nr:CPBP family intramembrane metalloprotease [Verrucomicrobiota bacterium]